MKQVNRAERGMRVALCLALALLAASVGAQRSKPIIETKVSPAVAALYAEPKLSAKVWLIAPESDIGRLLRALMARTTPLTHLKLQAQNSLQQTPVSCFAAGVPLRDLLDGLTVPGPFQWRRTNEASLMLGVGDFDLQHDENQHKIAGYAMRVVSEVQKQPAGLWRDLTQSRVRLGNMPLSVQQALQSLLRARAELPQPQNLPLLEVPANPQEMSICLNEESVAGQRGYLLSFLQEKRVSAGLEVMQIGLRFAPEQASPLNADEPHEQNAELSRDPRFAQKITLNLRAATLPDALKALFTATRLPMLAFTAGTQPRADLALTKMPLSAALDRICAAYDCRWQRRASGVVTLLKTSKWN